MAQTKTGERIKAAHKRENMIAYEAETVQDRRHASEHFMPIHKMFNSVYRLDENESILQAIMNSMAFADEKQHLQSHDDPHMWPVLMAFACNIWNAKKTKGTVMFVDLPLAALDSFENALQMREQAHAKLPWTKLAPKDVKESLSDKFYTETVGVPEDKLAEVNGAKLHEALHIFRQNNTMILVLTDRDRFPWWGYKWPQASGWLFLSYGEFWDMHPFARNIEMFAYTGNTCEKVRDHLFTAFDKPEDDAGYDPALEKNGDTEDNAEEARRRVNNQFTRRLDTKVAEIEEAMRTEHAAKVEAYNAKVAEYKQYRRDLEAFRQQSSRKPSRRHKAPAEPLEEPAEVEDPGATPSELEAEAHNMRICRDVATWLTKTYANKPSRVPRFFGKESCEMLVFYHRDTPLSELEPVDHALPRGQWRLTNDNITVADIKRKQEARALAESKRGITTGRSDAAKAAERKLLKLKAARAAKAAN